MRTKIKSWVCMYVLYPLRASLCGNHPEKSSRTRITISVIFMHRFNSRWCVWSAFVELITRIVGIPRRANNAPSCHFVLSHALFESGGCFVFFFCWVASLSLSLSIQTLNYSNFMQVVCCWLLLGHCHWCAKTRDWVTIYVYLVVRIYK